jgi:hypothetical protein
MGSQVGLGNSLIGMAGAFGDDEIRVFADGNFAIHYPRWSTPELEQAGLMLLQSGQQPLAGLTEASAGIVGEVPMDLRQLSFVAYDAVGRRMLVGRPLVNKVSILSLPQPMPFADGFEGP